MKNNLISLSILGFILLSLQAHSSVLRTISVTEFDDGAPRTKDFFTPRTLCVRQIRVEVQEDKAEIYNVRFEGVNQRTGRPDSQTHNMNITLQPGHATGFYVMRAGLCFNKVSVTARSRGSFWRNSKVLVRAL
jgi:hypothetical protein